MTAAIYVRFCFDNYGYQAGDIVLATLYRRDNRGVYVRLFSPEHNERVNAWSDLGSFEEVSPLEVLALAASEMI